MATDFRSYLATVDKNALAFTGNDGRIDTGKKGYDTNQGSYLNTSGNQKTVQDYISGLYNTFQNTRATPPPPVYRPPTPYIPKIVNFDIMANYNKARQTAAAAVNPTYDRYMSEFLANQNAQIDVRRKQNENTKAATALDLSQTLAKNATEKERTAQDEASAIQKLGEQEGQFQQQSGTQFDADRRAAAEAAAAAGTVTSIGQGVIFDQNNKRNLDEAAQVKEYANQREAKKVLATRTLEDLARGDADAQAITANKNQAADFDLEAYLQDQANEKMKFTNSNEIARMTETASQAATYEKQGTQSFLQSLAGQGYNSQDIAQAYAMYG